MATFLAVRNFEKYQHYKDRRPPWIKLYANLLDDDRFFDLSDAERYQLIGLFILASQHDNKIPNKSGWLQHQLRTSKPISLQNLIDTGWIMVVEQDASGVLAESLQDAIPRARAERRGEKSREEEKEPLATEVAGAVEYSADFELFWKTSTKRGSKPEAYREYKKFSKSMDTLVEIQKGMWLWQHSDQWQDESKQPHIGRWLKRRGWEEIVPNGNHRNHIPAPIVDPVEGSRRGGELTERELEGARELIELRRQRGE